MKTKLNIYDVVTNKIIENLENGVIPWNKPWSGGCPKNFISGKDYRGMNAILLTLNDYKNNNWLTFKQAKLKGGSIKKGEKGTQVIFWNFTKVEKKDSNGDIEEKSIPFIKYYTVFNIEQTKDIDFETIEESFNFDNIEKCEDVVKNMQNKPEIEHIGNSASYSPSLDRIKMPEQKKFKTNTGYYSTIFHELTHSTGHTTRLDRDGVEGVTHFGSATYSKEELIAEMGSSFLCGHTGIEKETIDNASAYIKGWLSKLKNDNKILIQAAGKAQKAVDYILGEG